MDILFDIITVGSNTLDLFVKTNSPVVHLKKNKKKINDTCIAYPLGDKIIITHLEFQVGGGGTNTAVAFSRLGLKTAYIGKIGDDDAGLKVFRLLKKEKVRFIGTIGKETGVSVVLDSIHEDRTILTYKGCNNYLSFKEIKKKNLITNWFYFSSMIDKSFETLVKLSEYAKKSNISIAINPSSYLIKLGIKKLTKILEMSNILILNKEEALLLSNRSTIKEALKKLKKLVLDIVVITDGNKGAWCYDGKVTLFAKSNKKIKIIETTGAGDAFASGFVTGIIWNKSLESSFKMGFLEAEAVIQAYGAKKDLLSKNKITKLLIKDKRKIFKKNI